MVIAKSANALFASQLLANGQGVQAVAATSGLGVGLSDNVVTNDADTTVTVNAPAPGSDTLSGLQWDMDQIHAPEARAISGGSPSVIVGDIDTGLDYTHPDLAPNVDFANSVSCIGGVPDQTPSA